MDAKAYTIVNKDLLNHLYTHNRMGLPKIKKHIEQTYKIVVSVGFLANRCNEYGIKIRTASEARRGWDENCLDYNKSFLSENTKEWIDGFLLGDGSASLTNSTKVARLSCGVEYKEFCEYMRSGLLDYSPTEIKYYPAETWSKSSNGLYNFNTRNHPDLYKHSIRWYGDSTRKHIIPDDVIITPTSVLLWYLGDGTVINKNNTTVVRLSTDSFHKEKIEEILVPKMKSLGIDCKRNCENRVVIKTKSIPAFFNFIGRTSPIECYKYKFELPEWRFEAVRMKEFAKKMNVSYNRLAHLVKKGTMPCYRASNKGKPRFLPQHEKEAQSLIEIGELY